MKTPGRTVALIGLAAVIFARLVSAQPLPSGRWDGAIRIMGQNLGIRVQFTPDGDSLKARIDIPVQNAFGLLLTNVRCIPPSIAFDLPAGPGVALFRGRMAGDSIGGSFEQSGITGTFFLRPAALEPVASEKPASPPPYKSLEVTFPSDTITLAGTLTVPSEGGPFPGLVMVTGSGPQNRDEEIFGFKPFAVIADHLTRNGIAVLRFDDRGVGGSGGRFAEATTTDFAADAEAGLNFLRQQPGIRKDAAGLLGHSEGGIAVGLVAAKRKDVCFLILLAAPGIRGDSLIDFQLTSMARRGGAPPEEIRRLLDMQHSIYATVRSGTGFEEVEELLVREGKRSLASAPEAYRKSISSPDSLIRSRVAVQMASIRSPWFKELTTLDPARAFERVSCPVLALFGEVDQQVPPSLNREPMEQAFMRGGNRNVMVHTFPKTNHLFLSSETGDPAEYGTLKKEFVEGFLEKIGSWTKSRFNR